MLAETMLEGMISCEADLAVCLESSSASYSALIAGVT